MDETAHGDSCLTKKFSDLDTDEFKAANSQEALQNPKCSTYQCVMKLKKWSTSNKITCKAQTSQIDHQPDLREVVRKVSISLTLAQEPFPDLRKSSCDLKPVAPTDEIASNLAETIQQKLKSFDKPQLEKAFIRGLHQQMINDGEAIQSGEGYDVIIIGAGVAGTQTAVILAATYKVLVIDAQLFPSSFGIGEFFLNTGKINRITDADGEDFIQTHLLGQIPYNTTGPDAASKMTDYLLLNLFQSGADVILGHKVVRTFYSDLHSGFPIAVEIEPRKIFYAKKVIEALGPGYGPYNPFPDVLIPGTDNTASVLSEHTFISLVRDRQAAPFLSQQNVAVIGGGPGGQITVLAARGLTPEYYSQIDQGELQDKVTKPEQLFWIGEKAKLQPTGLSDSPIRELSSNEVTVIPLQVKAVSKINSSPVQYRITMSDNSETVVDKVILAAGRKAPISTWNHEKEDLPPEHITQIQPDTFITSVLAKAKKTASATIIKKPIHPKGQFQQYKQQQRLLSLRLAD